MLKTSTATNQARPKRPLLVWWVLSGSVVLLVIAYFVVSRKPTLQSSAERLASCIASQNEHCVSEYVSSDELKEVGLDKGSIEKAVGLAIAYIGQAGVVSVKCNDPSEEVIGRGVFTAVFTTHNGEKALPLDLAYADDGIMGTNLLTTLLNMKWREDPRPVIAKSRGGAIMARILRGVSEDRAALESYGMKGVLYKGRPMSFDEYAIYCATDFERSEGLATAAQ